MIDSTKAAFCGDYCGKCQNYPKECAGCDPKQHMDCHFVRCCTSKGIEHCGLCSSFPCTKLVEWIPDDRLECPKGYHVENLRRRREIGIEAWLKEQAAKWGA